MNGKKQVNFGEFGYRTSGYKKYKKVVGKFIYFLLLLLF